MESPRRALLRLRTPAGPVSLVDDGEGDEVGGDGGRLIVAVADSDRTCCPVMVAEWWSIQPTCGLACASSKDWLVRLVDSFASEVMKIIGVSSSTPPSLMAAAELRAGPGTV